MCQAFFSEHLWKVQCQENSWFGPKPQKRGLEQWEKNTKPNHLDPSMDQKVVRIPKMEGFPATLFSAIFWGVGKLFPVSISRIRIQLKHRWGWGFLHFRYRSKSLVKNAWLFFWVGEGWELSPQMVPCQSYPKANHFLMVWMIETKLFLENGWKSPKI